MPSSVCGLRGLRPASLPSAELCECMSLWPIGCSADRYAYIYSLVTNSPHRPQLYGVKASPRSPSIHIKPCDPPTAPSSEHPLHLPVKCFLPGGYW